MSSKLTTEEQIERQRRRNKEYYQRNRERIRERDRSEYRRALKRKDQKNFYENCKKNPIRWAELKKKQKEYRANYRKTHKYKHQQSKAVIRRRRAIRLYKSNIGCIICHETAACCLHFHHLSNDKKMDVALMVMSGKSEDMITEEVNKCTLLCANCHEKFHDGILPLPEKTQLPTLEWDKLYVIIDTFPL
jgi:YesN/AraC family two-component response regulator